MSPFEKEMLSACKANLAITRRNLKLYKRFLNSPETKPREKEFLEELIGEYERQIQTCKKWIKHHTSRATQEIE